MNRKPTVSGPSTLSLALTLTFGVTVFAACSRGTRSSAPAEAVAASSRAKATSPAPTSPGRVPQHGPSRGSLADRLAAEVATRPPAGPHVEDVTAALRRAGVSIGPLTQVLGRTIGARYCASTATAAGVAIAMCEFTDDAEAARGLEYSHRQFNPLVPGRTLLRNRGTVLTLTPGDAGSAPAADARRAAAVFASL